MNFAQWFEENFTNRVREVYSRQIKDWQNVGGNVIRISVDNYLIMVFDDKRWAYFGVRCWPEGGSMVYFEQGRPSLHVLKRAGLLSEREYAEQIALESQARRNQREQNERREYERLKEKFDAVS